MKGYVYCISKKGFLNQDIKCIVDSIDYWKECEHQYEFDVCDNIVSIAYTNENVALNSKQGQYFYSYSGQLGEDLSKLTKILEQYNPAVAKNYIKSFTGAFSFGFIYRPTKTVRVYTHFARVNPVYYYEDEKYIVIGTDPLIVQVIAYQGNPPKVAVEQSISFLMNGYYADNETIFKDVKAVPENTEVIIENEKIVFEKIDNSIENMFMKKPTKEDYDELTHSYLQAYDIIPKSNKPHRIGLTGGKDSRLIALGLLEKGIPFQTLTRGFEDHPDVIIAQKIARKLKLEHTINPPVLNTSKKLEVDIIDKILSTMIGTSGNVFGYENVKYNPVYQNRIGLTGVGAECVRGGYGNHSKKNPVDIEEELVKSFSPLSQYIVNEKQSSFERFLKGLGEDELSFKEAQSKHYIFYRVGRWAGGTRNSILYNADMYSPFFDNQFLKKATQLNINALIGEEVHFNIMKRLNPEIANMAFFASRWGFEQKGPKNPNEYKDWLKRNPVYAKTQLGSYNWRMLKNPDSTLRNAMKEILLNDPTDEIFEVVDYNQISKILEKPVSASLNKLIWGLASIKLYRDYLMSKVNLTEKKLHFSIPNNEVKLLKQQSEIRDLTTIILPINKSIDIYKEKQGVLFTRNKKEKGNMYVQTGTGPIVQPPKSEKERLNIEGRKKIRFRICFESVKSIDYDVYIMQFNDQKRVSSELIKVTYKKERTYIDKNIKIHDGAKYLKLAVKFKEREEDWKVNMKYAYMELN